MIRRAVDWLLSCQNADGGWGEDGDSYKLDYKGYEPAPPTPSQTAWAYHRPDGWRWRSPSSRRRTRHSAFFQRHPRPRWAVVRIAILRLTGFPRVFYLRYHGYAKYFPLWALARYRTLKNANTGRVVYGM